MAIDMGLDDPDSMRMLLWAIRIVDESVDRIRAEIGENPPSDDSEVSRLTRALPAVPISFDHAVYAAAAATQGALDQISYTLRNDTPTNVIVLQALLRSALVGSCRTAFALVPADPSARLHNARVLVAQESTSFLRALDAYADFESLLLMRPDEQDRARAREQNEALRDRGRLPGDGAVMTGAADVIGAALAAAPDYPDRNRQLQREHVIWLWNTYSGLAHTYSWPRWMPSTGHDARVPGDFPGDFFRVANTAHIAMLSLQSRVQPGSANTTAPVPLRSEPPQSQ